MGNVYPDRAVAAEGMNAMEASDVFRSQVYTRRDLYDAIKSAAPRTPDEWRLYNVTVKVFEHNGLMLPEDRLARVREMWANLSRIQAQFKENLNNDNTTVEFTKDNLDGVRADSLAAFARTSDGRYIVTTQIPDYEVVMRNANRSATRKAMYVAYNDRQAEKNMVLLEQAVGLRQTIAHELGYKTWADYQLDGRMAGSTDNVMAFLDALKGPLQEKNREEMAGLLSIKRGHDPAATTIDPWDVAYLQEEQKRLLYAYNADEVKEYFPDDTVVQGMFSTYGTVLGVRFDEVKDAPVWSPEVRLFRVSNLTGNESIGYLYLDLYPREYKHQFIFENGVVGERMVNGTRSIPVAVIVDNLAAPGKDKPSLMTVDDVETLFHETGHAMHSLLSTAPFGTLSGTNVEWDFVETPSQTFEEWAYDPQVMESVSGYYANTSQKIPTQLRDRIIASRNAGNGYFFSRQLVFALFDMRLHTTESPVNATEIYEQTFADVMGANLTAGVHMPATFGHLMDGYDAGYYGYLWSKVYALEIVDTFKKDGMTNQTTGMRLRKDVLAQGNMEDGTVLLENFLGRKPGVEALYTYIGINVNALLAVHC